MAITQSASGIKVDRGQYVIHAGVIGQGRPMIAIAGGPGFSGQALWGIGYGLKDSVKTFLFDQLGTGGSQMKTPKADFRKHVNLDGTVADMEALRVRSGVKKWAVLGQSWGVIVALCYASKHPSAVDHLVLTSVPGLDLDGFVLHTSLASRVPDGVQTELQQAAERGNLSSEGLAELGVLKVLPYYFFDSSIGLSVAKAAPDNLFSPKVFLGLQPNILSTEKYRISLTRLKRATFPVTMIQGHQDPCGAAMPYLLREKYLPSAKITMIDQCGHFPWMEQSLKFFDVLHMAMKLPLPAHLREQTDVDQTAVKAWFDERERAGWPFGEVRKEVR